LAVMIIGAYGYWRVRRWRFRTLAFVGAAPKILNTRKFVSVTPSCGSSPNELFYGVE